MRTLVLAVVTVVALVVGGVGPPVVARATFAATAQVDDPCTSGFFWEHRTCPVPALFLLDDLEAVGGVDAIPPIDAPTWESLDTAAGWLSDDSPLLVVAIDGEVRGYPLAVLVFHEVVNDTIGSVPVLVTYCPLCDSAVVFDRRLDGEVLTFGTSGLLFRSNLVLYDRASESLWLQLSGRSVAGSRFDGMQLRRLASNVLALAELRVVAPGAQVLARPDPPAPGATYGRNPYRGYDASGARGRPIFATGPPDDRLPPMARVVGLAVPGHPAVPLTRLRAARRVDLGEATVLWRPGRVSTLEARRSDDGRDVGQTLAFEARLSDGTSLDLAWEDDGVVDRRSGTVWDALGRGRSGPLADQELQPVDHDDTFWFAWTSYWGAVPLAGAP